MTYAFRCSETGLVEFCDAPGMQKCPYCGGMHDAYRTGAPEKKFGAPMVQTYKPRWSGTHGCMLTSRKQEDAMDAARGIATVTDREARDNAPFEAKKSPTIVSYRGQTKRHRVRRATGATAQIG